MATPSTTKRNTEDSDDEMDAIASVTKIWDGIAASAVPFPLKCLAIIKTWRDNDSLPPFEGACQTLERLEALATAERGRPF